MYKGPRTETEAPIFCKKLLKLAGLLLMLKMEFYFFVLFLK
jgi:hypothetical protein